MKESLRKKLIKYNNTYIPFHMPGHKRKSLNRAIPYGIDITEVEGFDNLHDMKGVLKNTAEKLAKVYGAKKSYPLVNGSTCGVLAGLYTLTRENKNILMARNCHKSVYNAAEMLDLNTYYMMPESKAFGIFGEINAKEIEEKIKKFNIGTVVITSPTYEGVISDCEKIYDVCKKCGAYLFIDSAHGAHLPELHRSSDISVMSLHKTLPSLTQTAVLNVYSENVNEDIVKHALSVFETSSPSYVLLASIDECVDFLMEKKYKFLQLHKNLDDFYNKTKSLKNLTVTYFDDRSKIIILSNDGKLTAKLLRDEKIETEMAGEKYTLAIATVNDGKKTFNALAKALKKIDKKCEKVKETARSQLLPVKKESVKDALAAKGDFFDLSSCHGKISLEYIWNYPPGSPYVVPGEELTEDVINFLKTKKDLMSTKGKLPKIYVK